MAHEDYSEPKFDKWITVGGVSKKTGEKYPDKVTGYYKGSLEIPNKFKGKEGEMKTIHVLQTSEGRVAVNSNTNMTNKFKESIGKFTNKFQRPPFNTEVIIKFEGEKPLDNGNTYKAYKVTFDAVNTIEDGDSYETDNTDDADVFMDSDDFEAAPSPSYSRNLVNPVDRVTPTQLKAKKAVTEAVLKSRK